MTALAPVSSEQPEQPGDITQLPPSLLGKVLAAAAAINSVPKDGRNTFHKYDYVSAEGLLMRVRGELLSRGVLLTAGVERIDERQRPTSQGGETTITTVNLEFIFIDTTTGEQFALPWVGRGEDPMDKGIGKALTNALKTFLRQQLLLAWGDDPEADEGSDERVSGSQSGNGPRSLITQARGLSDAQLNHALVSAGLPAAEKPFGAFTKIPADKADQITQTLAELHAS